MDYSSSEQILTLSKSENILEDILEKWRRGSTGPLPQLTPLQLLNALVLVEREGPVGRRALSETLQLNDGVVRGLLERLAASKMALVTVMVSSFPRWERRASEGFFVSYQSRRSFP